MMNLFVVVGAMLVASGANAAISCSIAVTSGINFGGYNTLATASNTAVGSLTVTCTGYSAVSSISVDLNKGSSGSYSTRTMKKGAVVLNYNIYFDALWLTIFGDGSAGTSHATALPSATGGTVVVQMYGSISPLQAVSVGLYQDSITATVNY